MFVSAVDRLGECSGADVSSCACDRLLLCACVVWSFYSVTSKSIEFNVGTRAAPLTRSLALYSDSARWMRSKLHGCPRRATLSPPQRLPRFPTWRQRRRSGEFNSVASNEDERPVSQTTCDQSQNTSAIDLRLRPALTSPLSTCRLASQLLAFNISYVTSWRFRYTRIILVYETS